MARGLRVDHLGTQRLEPDERALLVGLDQPRIPGHIGGQDRRKNDGWRSSLGQPDVAERVAQCGQYFRIGERSRGNRHDSELRLHLEQSLRH